MLDIEGSEVISKFANGDTLFKLIEDLFPYHRSLTGEGVVKTLSTLSKIIPLKIFQIESGTKVFDWEVPLEWKIRDAYIKDSKGNRIVDYRKSNLHILNYSKAVHKRMYWSELKEQLHTLPDSPDSIPYKTAYFQDKWGFCLSYGQFLTMQAMGEREYDVCIDVEFFKGVLSYGELYIEGETEKEVLISCHLCHPSLANDNLSGIAVATYLAEYLLKNKPRYSYRFIFIPATIGSISWLATKQDILHKIEHGLVLTLLGDPGKITYKKSRHGNAEIDQITTHVLSNRELPFEVRSFSPDGYDERQFCSPGINLAMGCLMRTPNGEFPEYHTSADNLQFVESDALEDSLSVCVSIVEVLENNRTYLNLNPMCEPRLGARSLFCPYSADHQRNNFFNAILWVLNYSDGKHSLLQIAEIAGMAFIDIKQAALSLVAVELLQECTV